MRLLQTACAAFVSMFVIFSCIASVLASDPDTSAPGLGSLSPSSSGDDVVSSASGSFGSLVNPFAHETVAKFAGGFFSSTSMILVSEIGDKTFFIAAIMAMRHPRWEVFSSAIAALALMTVLSAAMGFTLPLVLSPRFTHLASTVLFLFFGCRLLYDAYHMEANVANLEELEEVESELEKGERDDSPSSSINDGSGSSSVDTQRKSQSKISSIVRRCFSPVFIQVFIMTFLAEWGDRSQIATIALAAAKDPIGVTAGGICGHAACTGVAVIGGKLLATRISERTISIAGGILFLLFALHSLFFDDQ